MFGRALSVFTLSLLVLDVFCLRICRTNDMCLSVQLLNFMACCSDWQIKLSMLTSTRNGMSISFTFVVYMSLAGLLCRFNDTHTNIHTRQCRQSKRKLKIHSQTLKNRGYVYLCVWMLYRSENDVYAIFVLGVLFFYLRFNRILFIACHTVGSRSNDGF